MEIKKGSLYINRTLKYLFPTTLHYGNTFKAKIGSVFCMAFGIHDCILDGTPFEKERKICVLIDRTYQPTRFQDFLNWIKNQEYYLADYVVGDFTGWQHMVIIRYPIELSDAYDKFVQGKYSKMLCREEVELFFPGYETQNPSPVQIAHKHALQVITKSPVAKGLFVNAVMEKFGTVITQKDFYLEKPEYDFPPDKKEEFFNFK